MSHTQWTKVLVAVGSSVAAGVAAYLAYVAYQRSVLRNKDEGFEDTSRLEEVPENRILVLGLSGAGKSSILSRFSSVESIVKGDSKPTEGFSVKCVQVDGMSLNIWEIGGAEHVRLYWSNFLQDTNVLVFVVDSADSAQFPTAFDELHKLLGDSRLRHVPILIIANKQDLPKADRPEKVADMLGLNSIPSREHQVQVIGTQVPPSSDATHPSVLQAESHMIDLCQGRGAAPSLLPSSGGISELLSGRRFSANK